MGVTGYDPPPVMGPQVNQQIPEQGPMSTRLGSLQPCPIQGPGSGQVFADQKAPAAHGRAGVKQARRRNSPGMQLAQRV